MTHALGTRALGALLAVGLLVSPAAAQNAPFETEWTHGSTVSVFGGLGVDGTQTAAAAGGGFAWEVTRRLSFEVNGTWLDRGTGADAYAGDFSVVVMLVPPQRISPFVRFGGGAYGASFDVAESPIPDFYGRRLEEDPPGVTRRVSFNDPAFLFGGGINAWLGLHTSLRPEVELRGVVDGGRVYWLTTVAVRLAFHFEEHPRSSRR